jgi:CsoR family transcriptional regulator, copper-sensing transcriptional repressor
MSAVTVTAPTSVRSPRVPTPGRRRGEDIVSRLHKATGQMAGVRAMYEDGRYCIDVLDQLAAATAAIDSVALLILEDHINACVADAMHNGNPELKVAELVSAVRRYVRTR